MLHDGVGGRLDQTRRGPRLRLRSKLSTSTTQGIDNEQKVRIWRPPGKVGYPPLKTGGEREIGGAKRTRYEQDPCGDHRPTMPRDAEISLFMIEV